MGRALGEFEQLILYAILHLGESAYGMSIRRAIESRTGRDVSAGAIYTTLERLQNRDMVESRTGDEAEERAGRPRKYYRLRPNGILELKRSHDALNRMAEGLGPKLGALAEEAAEGAGP